MRRRFSLLAPLTLGLTLALGAIPAWGAATISAYELPTHDLAPTGIALGPDSNVWFTENAGSGAIGKITPEGTISEYSIGLTPSSKPLGIAAGPDGNLWFTEASNPGRIGRISPLGTITEFSAGLTNNGKPSGITAGPDGNLWFTEAANPGRIGRVTPAGVITEFSTGLTGNREPTSIVTGPDGNLWFTESAGNGAIGRITPTGTITEFTTGLTASSKPSQIAAGPDGNLWFTEAAGTGRIGRITVGGTITEFSSGLTPSSQPEGITAGVDGALYFTEAKNPGRIGRITTAGSVSETAVEPGSSEPLQIVTGGDGNLWFTEAAAHGLIGKLTVAPGTGTAAPAATERTAILKALVDPASQTTTYVFQYGPSPAYGSQTGSKSAGSGAALTGVSAVASGLEPGTLYHFRVVATNQSGSTYGADQTVTTGIAPAATTHAASEVTLVSAKLNADVNPHGAATSYVFEWGTSTSYGHEAPAGGTEAGSDNALHQVAQTIGGLTADTRYHFRVRATNCGGCAEGTTEGADQTFTTAAAPVATTALARGVTSTAAILAGSVEGRNAETSYHFDWGETTAYGELTVAQALAASGSAQSVTGALGALLPGHLYHYRLVATNCEGCEAGTSYGADMTFTTVAAAPTAPSGAATATTSPTLPGLPLAPPAFGKTAAVKVLSGTVTVTAPGGTALALTGPADIPVGTTVDAHHGRLEMTTALPSSGHAQSAIVWGARFTLGQPVSGHGMTTMTLPGAKSCAAAHAKRATLAARSRGGRTSETLWAKDNHGRYSTRGHNSVATVRGTEWGTAETCAGTLTTVRKGAVTVKPRHGRPVLVRAGHSYLARR